MNLKHAFAFLLLICIGSIPLKSRAVGIEFNHGSWAEIVSKAKAENKLIFIDFYTQWCGPCLNMAQNVFTQPEVGEFYNQNFVNAKIDAEHGEGRDLAKKYKIRFYPSYVLSILLRARLFISAAADRLQRNLLLPVRVP